MTQSIIDLIESYARHYQLEQNGHRNRADELFTAIIQRMAIDRQAIARATVNAYREGKAGVGYHPAYQEWEREGWEAGRADAGEDVYRVPSLTENEK